MAESAQLPTFGLAIRATGSDRSLRAIFPVPPAIDFRRHLMEDVSPSGAA